MSDQEVVVSVWMTTYNHERYIAQAIESIVNQKTSFQFELLIGEDCSTDKTGEICQEFADRYPEIIRLFRRPRNWGVTRNGIETVKEARGKYIAICEGDDYWTDPLKLQKQVDFLEANPEFSMCFHNAYVIEGDALPSDARKYFNFTKDEYELADLFGPAWFTPTASVVMRRSAIMPLPDWFATFAVDTILFSIAATTGKLKLLPDTMSVYRHHGGGVTKSLSYEFWERYLGAYYALAKTYPIPQSLLAQREMHMLYNMTQCALAAKDRVRLKRSAWALLTRSIRAGMIEWKYGKIVLISIAPGLYYRVKRA